MLYVIYRMTAGAEHISGGSNQTERMDDSSGEAVRLYVDDQGRYRFIRHASLEEQYQH